MRIDELFDKPLPLEWKDELGANQANNSATFQIDDMEFKIQFIGDADEFDLLDANTVAVTFGQTGRNHYFNARNVDASRDFKHKTVLIFSTVAHAIDEYWKKENPDAMYFAASSHRQEKTYNKMMKFFNSTKPEYDIKLRYNVRDGEYYEITK